MLLLILLSTLAACGGSPATPAPGQTAGPTADVGGPPPSDEATPTAAPTTAGSGPIGGGSGPLKTPYLQYGAAGQLYYVDRERALTLMNNANFDWLRQQVPWQDTEGPKGNFGWDELDAIVEAASAHNTKVLLSIVGAPAWARADGLSGLPDNPADLGDFVEAMAIRYKGRVQAYEIWNEENLDHENGGLKENINAGHYVDILAECYNRIKAIDPDAYVISGALTSTGETPTAVDDLVYYEQMFSYNSGSFGAHVDGIGFHPAPAYNPPDTKWPENPGPGPGWQDHPTHYFRHIEDLYALMQQYGLDDHQVWITEAGYATANTSSGYEYGNAISPELQAEYMLGALQRTRNEYPWVGAFIIWNLNFAVTWGEQDPPQPLHEQASFSMLNADWSPRPLYTAVQGFIGAVKTEEGRMP